MKPIRVLLVDDHSLVRAGIRALLQNLPGIEVVAEAGDGREALRWIASQKPDVVLMDLAMPGWNGLEAVSRLTRKFPDVRVVILSMHSNEEYVVRALRAGATGYLIKEAPPAELELAVRAVAAGETYLSPPLTKRVVFDYMQRVGGETGPLEQLTPRQREILQLIAEGHTTKEIARLLDLGVKTVQTHRTELMERLNIHEVTGLVRFAIRNGLMTAQK